MYIVFCHCTVLLMRQVSDKASWTIIAFQAQPQILVISNNRTTKRNKPSQHNVIYMTSARYSKGKESEN